MGDVSIYRRLGGAITPSDWLEGSWSLHQLVPHVDKTGDKLDINVTLEPPLHIRSRGRIALYIFSTLELQVCKKDSMPPQHTEGLFIQHLFGHHAKMPFRSDGDESNFGLKASIEYQLVGSDPTCRRRRSS